MRNKFSITMASRKMTDANFIPYLSENYEKEKWLRMHWVNRHMGELKRATTLDREPTNYTKSDIRRERIAACMPSLARSAVEGACNKKTAPLKDICLVKLDNITKECKPPMKPITDEQRELLYVSKTAYLKLRYDIPPDKKYNYVECMNWKYGWNLDESDFKLRGSVHGRIFHLRRMKGIGPQPDPIHYQEGLDSYTICNCI